MKLRSGREGKVGKSLVDSSPGMLKKEDIFKKLCMIFVPISKIVQNEFNTQLCIDVIDLSIKLQLYVYCILYPVHLKQSFVCCFQ